MARPIRIEYEGAVYHAYARGNDQRAIFKDDSDRRLFLKTLEEMQLQHGILIHAYCLMPNHYHLAVETPRANLTRGLGWLQVTYTVRFNRRHNRSGHLFQGRYSAQVVEADQYAQELVRYIHLNPVRPRDKTREIPRDRRKELSLYPWSSHHAYIGTMRQPQWLTLSWLSYWGDTQQKARTAYIQHIDSAFGQKTQTLRNRIPAGLVVGDDAFKEKIKAMISGKKGYEEIRWVNRAGREEAEKKIRLLLEKETDKKLRMWIRARLGGEKLTEIGRSLGYRDGAGVLQAVKRLERAAGKDTALAEKLKDLRASANLSSVES